MALFQLPIQSRVGRVIPKNAFDNYTNTNQKKLFTDLIQRITWTHKLSPETVNLDSGDVSEIQLFKIELKRKSEINNLIELIQRAIPYHIIFWIEFEEESYLSTASKHLHPVNPDSAVVDWTFVTPWFSAKESCYSINLKGNLDSVFKDICVQITGNPEFEKKSLAEILQNQKQVDRLEKEITKLKSVLKTRLQFNKKVEINQQLLDAKRELADLKSGAKTV
jgi:hypothetical protein